ELFRGLLVAQHVRLLGRAIVEDVLAVHALHAFGDALGIGAHFHVFMVCVVAHVVRDDAGESGAEGEGRRGSRESNQFFHWSFPFFLSISSQSWSYLASVMGCFS